MKELQHQKLTGYPHIDKLIVGEAKPYKIFLATDGIQKTKFDLLVRNNIFNPKEILSTHPLRDYYKVYHILAKYKYLNKEIKKEMREKDNPILKTILYFNKRLTKKEAHEFAHPLNFPDVFTIGNIPTNNIVRTQKPHKQYLVHDGQIVFEVSIEDRDGRIINYVNPKFRSYTDIYENLSLSRSISYFFEATGSTLLYHPNIGLTSTRNLDQIELFETLELIAKHQEHLSNYYKLNID